MSKASEKTNVMRVLDSRKIPYEARRYDPALTEGTLVAEALGEQAEKVYKTLVTVSDRGEHVVFVIPVAESLDLKRAAKTVGAKSVAMIKQKELLPLTGYVHGGCSPVGMKKQFVTVIDESAREKPTICVSAGKLGFQVELDPQKLAGLINAQFAEITVTADK